MAIRIETITKPTPTALSSNFSIVMFVAIIFMLGNVIPILSRSVVIHRPFTSHEQSILDQPQLTSPTTRILELSNSSTADTTVSTTTTTTTAAAVAAAAAATTTTTAAIIQNAISKQDEVVAREQLTKNLPEWLTSYMDWHRTIKPTLTPENWDQHQYLVLRCLSWFPFCSGTADRLRNFLFLIYLAQSDPTHENRIFLIHWSRPAPLEEFLVPPVGGLDWSVPDWLLPKLALGNESHWFEVEWNEDSLLTDYRIKTYYTVVEFSFTFTLQNLVNKHEQQYRDCFQAVFQPSPGVQAIVDQTKQELGLTGKYTSVHLRMKYTSISENEAEVWQALQCAEKLGDPTTPIFVASDSGDMARLATQLAIQRNLSRVVVARNDYDVYPSLHIDMGADYLNPTSEDWKRHNASEYYTVFSDLLLLGDSSCVAAATGSYGKWGSRLSRNVSCFANYATGAGCS